jgi:hypothetical protein
MASWLAVLWTSARLATEVVPRKESVGNGTGGAPAVRVWKMGRAVQQLLSRSAIPPERLSDEPALTSSDTILPAIIFDSQPKGLPTQLVEHCLDQGPSPHISFYFQKATGK